MASRASEVWTHQPRYRRAVPFPRGVKENCRIYLDEGLYINALALLADLVTPGASHPNHLFQPSYAPEPYHLEIISTLLVHPKFTTQRTQDERVELASRSITLLRNVLAILGPLNANLGEAFSLAPPAGRNRRGRNQDDSSEDDDDERIRGIAANQGRVRVCAKDFWHVVGWAFNCSVVYPKRWRHWKVWLDYMLDMLDADWKERARGDEDDENTDVSIAGDKRNRDIFTHRQSSLLVKYLADARGRSSAVKRIVASVFTDGGADDLRSFPEVFPNETAEPKVQNGQKRKREEGFMNGLGNGFGDDDDDENEEFISSQTSEPPLSQATHDGEASPGPMMGGTEAMALRQRLLVLLSRVAFEIPASFVDIPTLYNFFVDNIKLLPLPVFSLLIAASDSSHFRLDVYITLTQFLFNRLLPKEAPHTIGQPNDNDEISQALLEQRLLPFSANTSSTDDNARLSIMAENVFRLLIKSTLEDIDSELESTPALSAAVEKGIKAREAKIKGDKRRNARNNAAARKEELGDRQWLNASSARLRSLVKWVELMEITIKIS